MKNVNYQMEVLREELRDMSNEELIRTAVESYGLEQEDIDVMTSDEIVDRCVEVEYHNASI